MVIDINLLIIGGAGYIGSYLVYKFSNDHRIERVYVVDVRKPVIFSKYYKGNVMYIEQNIKDFEKLKGTINRLNIDVVIHLAATFKKNILELIETNVIGTMHILEALRDKPITLFIFASTAANLYGNALYRPIDEKHPLNPVSLYGLSKRMAEDAIEFYAKRYGIPTVTFRQTNVYGWAPLMKHTVINTFIRSALSKKEITIFGNGKQQRNFLHIEDLARYYEAAIFHSNPEVLAGEVINIAGPETVTIRQLAEFLKQLLERDYGIKVRLVCRKARGRENEIYDFPISFKKATRLLGVNPKIDLKTGLKIELKRILEHEKLTF